MRGGGVQGRWWQPAATVGWERVRCLAALLIFQHTLQIAHTQTETTHWACPCPMRLECRLAAMTELQREYELANRAEKRNQELQRQKLLKMVEARGGVL